MVFASFSSFQYDQMAIDNLLNNPTGMVGRHVAALGTGVLALAVSTAPVGPNVPATRFSVGRTGGALKASLHQRPGMDGKGPYVDVGSALLYAAVVVKGSKPHSIRAGNKQSLYFRAGGVEIFVRSVRHPGTSPNPFLFDAARRVLRGG